MSISSLSWRCDPTGAPALRPAWLVGLCSLYIFLTLTTLHPHSGHYLHFLWVPVSSMPSFSLSPLFSCLLENVPLGTSLRKGIWENKVVDVFNVLIMSICPQSGFILWVSITSCAENHYFSELWRSILFLLPSTVASEKCNLILILNPFHTTCFPFSLKTFGIFSLLRIIWHIMALCLCESHFKNESWALWWVHSTLKQSFRFQEYSFLMF